MKYKLPKTLVLDYDKWICGKPDINTIRENCLGEGATRLLNEQGEMCCLGQFSDQAGVCNEDMYGVGGPQSIRGHKTTIVGLTKPRKKTGVSHTLLALSAMSLNDNMQYTVSEKAQHIKELFAKNGYEVTLKNFPDVCGFCDGAGCPDNPGACCNGSGESGL